MWVARFSILHDCIIANKCREFKVSTVSQPFNVFLEKGTTHSPEVHTLWGTEENINSFVQALKEDKRVKNLEVEGNTLFLIEVTKSLIPVSVWSSLAPKLLFTKPINIDNNGVEHWEVATWDKSIINNFLSDVKKIAIKLDIKSIKETKLTDIYFSRFMPKLTLQQRLAITIAFEFGYYVWPRKTDLGKLAKAMGISVATFREHLKRAEEKLMPNLIMQLK
ncbi:MAG: helix-turn-helix domain-containing protein [Candidatus Micrarchaeota archaeon]|nr:helix-turn-helix domain-containing protein [Candidatus Micrarchaeota archaeon]